MSRRALIVLVALVVFGSGCQELRFQLSNAPGYGAIAGLVTGADGKPVGGAEVAAEPPIFGIAPVYKTDATGEFLVPRVPVGKVMVVASNVKDGYPDARFALFVTDIKVFPTVTVEEGRITRNVVSPKGGKLEGSILDSKTGLPVVVSRIHLYRLDMSWEGNCRAGLTSRVTLNLLFQLIHSEWKL